MEVVGVITKVLDKVTGQKKDGSGEWVKQSFVIDTEETYNNIICFEVFGAEKVEALNKYNSVGDKVTVTFNINCNEWEGRFFTTLGAWRIETAQKPAEAIVPETSFSDEVVATDDIPF